jgi:predicted nucleotidyltransferase
VDVSLLRENLRLTPSQRVEKMFRGQAIRPSEATTEVQPALWSLLAALERAKVRCVLIGSRAMSCYGSEFHTQDVDLCYSRDTSNFTALAEALTPFHPRLRGAMEGLLIRVDERTLRSGINFLLVTDAADVDLLGHVPGVDSFEALRNRASEMELVGVPVWVASLDDLITMKRAAGRPNDQLHLTELEELRARAAKSARLQKRGA